jgi:hypothetical protein
MMWNLAAMDLWWWEEAALVSRPERVQIETRSKARRDKGTNRPDELAVD